MNSCYSRLTAFNLAQRTDNFLLSWSLGGSNYYDKVLEKLPIPKRRIVFEVYGTVVLGLCYVMNCILNNRLTNGQYGCGPLNPGRGLGCSTGRGYPVVRSSPSACETEQVVSVDGRPNCPSKHPKAGCVGTDPSVLNALRASPEVNTGKNNVTCSSLTCHHVGYFGAQDHPGVISDPPPPPLLSLEPEDIRTNRRVAETALLSFTLITISVKV